MSIKSMLSNMSNYEFIGHCETIKIEDIGILFREAMARLREVEQYGCGDCGVCDDRSDESAIILEEIKHDLRGD